MGRDGREILVGMAAFVTLVFALGLSYGAGRLKPAGGYALTATFNRVDGLSVGDDVRLSGMKVGGVERQLLDDNYRALVTFRITSDVKLPTDTAAAIHTDGLFGTKFVILDPGGEDATLEPGGNISFTQDAVLVDELLELVIAEGKARGATKGEN
jgi:phospholipid/cholesterol/gamma-HCH transport system substrate-binding protein